MVSLPGLYRLPRTDGGTAAGIYLGAVVTVVTVIGLAICQAMAIWRDLVDDHGFPAQYASVRRFVVKLRGQRTPEAHPVIVTLPGEEGQVDYGDGPMVRHPSTRKYRRTRLFVFTLGYSRKSVRLLTFASSTRRWCELHEETFRRLGGAVKVVILDNLREGVLTPDIYDPALNPLYRDLLAHYGVVALPCRVGDPDRKGKVESAIGHTQAALTGLRFERLEDAQVYLDRWDARWADTRIHGTTKRQVAAMFAEERPTLLPLPVDPFRYYQFGTHTVHLDGCIEVEYAYYGAPPGWLGREVAVQWDTTHVRLIESTTGRLLREHRRPVTRGRHVVHPDDRPPRTPPTTVTLLARAARAGPHIGPLCVAIHHREGELGVRRILGVLSLVKKHGAVVVDAACAAALELELTHYRFVRRYVERHPAAPLTLRQVDPLIRELTHYRDVIARKTQEESPPSIALRKISRTWPHPCRTSRSPSKKSAERRASTSAGGRYVSARQGSSCVRSWPSAGPMSRAFLLDENAA